MRAAVFLDLNGTIIEEAGYLYGPDHLELISRAAEAIRLLNEAYIPAIVFSNQAGVGRGHFSTATVEAMHEELAKQLASYGAHFDAIYYCPHYPSLGCECHKPRPGMLLQAAREHEVDTAQSFVVGDKISDLEAGRQLGCRTVLVLTGYGEQSREIYDFGFQPLGSGFQPAHIATDLYEAVKWILAETDPAKWMKWTLEQRGESLSQP
jgi:D-glycero-D-manno-heptose 1,7-bisphosphate phosphatase